MKQRIGYCEQGSVLSQFGANGREGADYESRRDTRANDYLMTPN